MQCSKTCGIGSKTRDVRCLDPDHNPADDCPHEVRPKTRESCNTHSCSNVIDEGNVLITTMIRMKIMRIIILKRQLKVKDQLRSVHILHYSSDDPRRSPKIHTCNQKSHPGFEPNARAEPLLIPSGLS